MFNLDKKEAICKLVRPFYHGYLKQEAPVKSARFETIGFCKDSLIKRMKEKNLAAVLLTTPENVMYTTGYPCLPGSGNPILFALRNQFPFLSFVEADGKVTLGCWIGAILGDVQFECDHMEIWADRVGARVTLNNFFAAKTLSGTKVGIESRMPVYLRDIIVQAAPDIILEYIDDVMDSLRLIKSDYELEMIRKATMIAETTMKELISEVVKPGITRPELIQEAKWRMIKNGATGIGHVTISFGTSNPEVSIDETLGTGQLVALDLGASYYGYLSDIRRHAFTGTIPEGLTSMHNKMIGIVDEISGYLVPGATAKDIYDLAVKIYEREGLIPLIVTAGHSIGLMTEEAWLYNGSDLVLSPDMVINIELYYTYEEGIEIGDEETYIITETIPEKITVFPVEIVSV
jgi:Xaa-Pro aminopeptidase